MPRTDYRSILMWATLSVATLTCAWPSSAIAKNWMVKAQQSMTCTSNASDQERVSLGTQWFPDGRAATSAEMQNLRRYVTGAGTSGEQKLFRYLSLLAGFAYQADYSNDQYLRSRFDGLILGHSANGVDFESVAATEFRNSAYCALVTSCLPIR